MSELEVRGGDKEVVRNMLVEMRPSHAAKAGDTKVMWNPRDPDEVQTARKAYERLVRKGFRAFRVGSDGKAITPAMTEFDPNAEKIILAPQMAGG